MDASGNGVAPFAIDQGVVKMVNARIAGANIDNLFVGSSNIEPGAMSVAKSVNIPNRSGAGTYDFVVAHGLNLANTHHESRFEFKGSASIGGSVYASFGITATDLATGTVVFQYFDEVGGPQSGSARSPSFNLFSYFSIPTGDRTSTTLRVTFTGDSRISYANMQVGCFVFKNVPNSV